MLYQWFYRDAFVEVCLIGASGGIGEDTGAQLRWWKTFSVISTEHTATPAHGNTYRTLTKAGNHLGRTNAQASAKTEIDGS